MPFIARPVAFGQVKNGRGGRVQAHRDPACRLAIRRELAVLGVTESVAYPDLDGLARDLRDRFLT